jgi:hypothetical protein
VYISGSINAGAGSIGGWSITPSAIYKSPVFLSSSAEPGLYIQDAYGNNKVLVASKSMYDVSTGTDLVGNDSFEEGTGGYSPGRNYNPTVPSWSLALGGNATSSITDRSAYADVDKANTGDYTLDIVVPSGSENYTSHNTYEFTQVITGSFEISNVLSFKGTSRFSHSLGGVGYNRNLEEQLFRVEYLSASVWTPFLPKSTRTGSAGFGFYRIGQEQFSSFGGSAVLPYTTNYLRIHLSGSVNSDATASFTVAKNASDPENSLKYTKYIYQVPKYPETEITFDSFDLKESIPRVELIPDGLLIYNSEDSYIRMTTDGIDIRGGSGFSIFGSSVSSTAMSNDQRVAGNLDAPSLQGSTEFPNAVSTSSVAGIAGDYSRYDHIHDLPFSTLNAVAQEGTFTSIDVNSITFAGGGPFTITGSLAVSSSVDSYFIGGGGVGIGTATPPRLASIYSSVTGDILRIATSADTGQALDIGIDTTNKYLYFTPNASATTYNITFMKDGNIPMVTFDQDTGYVGIGTTIPVAELHVQGDAIFTGTVTAQEFHAEFVSSSIIYESGSTKFGDSLDDYHDFTGSLNVSGSTHHILGNVGIGTRTPSTNLHVYKLNNTVYDINGATNSHYIEIENVSTTTNTAAGIELRAGSGVSRIASVLTGGSMSDLVFGTRNTNVTEKMRITAGGFVGIGTTNPNATLAVTGNTTLTGSLGISSTINAPNIGTGVDNSVIVLEADGTFGTDEIDSRV